MVELKDNVQQIQDVNGQYYVAVSPECDGQQDWFNYMLNTYDLYSLVTMFPYVVLKLDENSGRVYQTVQTNYNARVTNGFHVLYVSNMQRHMQYGFGANLVVTDNSNNTYALNLESAYHKEREVVEYTIPMNPEKMVYDVNNDPTAYSIENDKLPEEIVFEYLPEGWNPNKDAYGRYKTNQNGYSTQFYNPYLNSANIYSNAYIPNSSVYSNSAYNRFNYGGWPF